MQKKIIEKTTKIYSKKICAKHIYYIYKQFGFVWYNLKYSGMESGSLQSRHHHSLFSSPFSNRIFRFL
jgi:hypothetical protein